MQQIMEGLKFLNKIAVLTVSVFLLIGCHPKEPRESGLELKLKKQNVGEVFSFADYCEEEYDSIFLVYSYFNTERDDFNNLKMSDRLRRKCDNNACFDSFNTLLLVRDGTVKAYSIINCIDADFVPKEVEEHYIFPFKQKFILDNNRLIQLYEE